MMFIELNSNMGDIAHRGCDRMWNVMIKVELVNDESLARAESRRG
jgi:hypothetical protein